MTGFSLSVFLSVFIFILILDLIIVLLPCNGRGSEPPVRGCSERRPGAGPAAPAGGRGRQPAGPARRDGPHHRRLSRLHQGEQGKTEQAEQMETIMEKKKNLHNWFLVVTTTPTLLNESA